MIKRLERLKDKMPFLGLKYLLKKYDIKFIYEDEMGILSRRMYYDGLAYLFRTKYSCDAIPMMKALDSKIKNASISIDVGANIGITSSWIAMNSAKVYSFEPEPNNIKRFHENIRLNKLSNVELIEKGVSDREGPSDFYILESYGHHSLGKVSTSKFITTLKIELLTLDGFCKARQIESIDFLKIDVEGFELEVLLGAKELLRQSKIKLIAFEVSRTILKELNKTSTEIYELLHSFGYQLFDLKNSVFDKESFSSIIHEDVYAIC